MRYFILALVIVLCQNQHVNCSIFELFSTRINDFASNLATTIRKFREHVKSFFIITLTPQRDMAMYQLPPDVEIKRTFAHFVEMTAADNETELPEYTSMKTEPTALMSTPQLIVLHGRRVESHIITTRDGYLLTIHRILPIPNTQHKYSNQTIILHHGLLGSSADWILLGPQKSLPYMLSDVGYDVWLANARGNYYSRAHTWKQVESIEFWKFSWQEMGEFDLAAVIDYIRRTKKMTDGDNQKIDFIGHSMGATALLVLLSTLPNYNQYLRIGVLLAPIVYMTNTEGPLKGITSMSMNPPEQLLKIIGNKEFMPSRVIPKWLALKYCVGPLLFCCNPLYFISGGIPNSKSRNASFVARLLYHVPAGGSTNTILHYSQLVSTGKFHKFNDVYNEFNLGQVTLPIALMSSDDDWLATIPDVLRLYFSIVNPIDHHVIRGKNLSHTDFVWGKDADEIVFNKVLEYISNGLNWFAFKNNEIRSDGL